MLNGLFKEIGGSSNDSEGSYANGFYKDALLKGLRGDLRRFIFEGDWIIIIESLGGVQKGVTGF